MKVPVSDHVQGGDAVRMEFPEEPPNGSVLIGGDATTADGQAWQRRDGFGRYPLDFRWFPAGSYLPGPSAKSDYSVRPLMWRQLVAQLGTFTVVWQPPSKEVS